MVTPHKTTAANISTKPILPSAKELAQAYLAKLEPHWRTLVNYNSLPHLSKLSKKENAAYIAGLDMSRTLFEEVCWKLEIKAES